MVPAYGVSGALKLEKFALHGMEIAFTSPGGGLSSPRARLGQENQRRRIP